MKNNPAVRLLCLSLLFQASVLQMAWAGDSDHGAWTGSYSQASDLCTEPGSGRSCRDGFRDSLSIVEESLGYRVELHSIQAMQHVCSFVLHMKPEGGKLIHQSELGTVVIEQHAGALRVSSGGIDPTAMGLGLCGTHADIDGLEFPSAGNRTRSRQRNGARS
ncbi:MULTISPECIES: hypothetical protein [Stenotrophomonas]|uniref:DUF3617 family protein n=1 Tax=Stenotrophomonas maltophilia TaxID=40324 RepID=A0AAD0FJV7_STEMA|nr:MULTISPECIES: hypothetical protein [Stenotrophomonas]AUI05797.1 hypothetical protein SmaCSM2_00845 [Stenotrophomonas maltophilia]MBA2129428.1 hypothetical protein [Stenotrophomonas maltophilia]MBH1681941.1 hypothetical protein [Stenotrophomonas maltophilia]MBH1873935.1 hypothetical protein [Stenotrophomonas maltophilia]RIA20873.1 hypothetical protein DFO63_3188 [Stenotrophomonas sp. AG209]